MYFSPSVRITQNYWIQHAYNVIKDIYGDKVLVKPKNLLKFGVNGNIAQSTKTTIMTLAGSEANETYVSDNLITHFASGNSGDTGIELTIEGHTVENSELTFVTQTATLNASDSTTKTALTTPLARITRAYNSGTTSLTGPVYFAEDVTFTSGVPQTASAVHLIIAAGSNQSEKCATAFSKVDYGIITGIFGSATRASATANVDFNLEIREFGKVFRPAAEWTVRTASQSSVYIPLEPYVIVPKNADVRIVATSSAASTQASAFFNSVIALKQ